MSYNMRMMPISSSQGIRPPRFRRASEPHAFRVTDEDAAIVRHLARHRFLRSTHIAALVGRSLDRTDLSPANSSNIGQSLSPWIQGCCSDDEAAA